MKSADSRQVVTYSGTADDDGDEVAAAGAACRPRRRLKIALPQTDDLRRLRQRRYSGPRDPSGVFLH